MIVKWNDALMQNVYIYVDFSYMQNGARKQSTTVFNSFSTEVRSIDSLRLFNQEPVLVKVTVKDKYGNTAQTKDTTIVLLTDEKLSKTGWYLPAPGTVIGGVTQTDGNGNGEMAQVIDGLTEQDMLKNFYLTLTANPWNIIIDLGGEYELSRIVTHQRYSSLDLTMSGSIRGAFYRAENVLSYNMYIWDEENQKWELVSRHNILTPVVTMETDYVTLGNAGDKAFLYPEEPKFTKPTRYFRFEAINGKYISEITLYGKAK
jgi:hypothetical protein